MRTKAMFVCVFILAIYGYGCQGRNCLKIGGGYQGFEGEIEYCFDKEQSQKTDVPVLIENKASVQKEIFGFNLDQVNAILGKLRSGKIEAKDQKHPVREILEIIKK